MLVASKIDIIHLFKEDNTLPFHYRDGLEIVIPYEDACEAFKLIKGKQGYVTSHLTDKLSLNDYFLILSKMNLMEATSVPACEDGPTRFLHYTNSGQGLRYDICVLPYMNLPVSQMYNDWLKHCGISLNNVDGRLKETLVYSIALASGLNGNQWNLDRVCDEVSHTLS